MVIAHDQMVTEEFQDWRRRRVAFRELQSAELKKANFVVPFSR